MAARSSAAGVPTIYARSNARGGTPALRRYTPPAPVIAEAPSSPILDIVTSVNLICHLAPGYATRNAHFAWEDQSEYDNNFTASGDERPTIIDSWLDGNPAVQFDGISQKLRRAVFRGLGVGSKPCLIVVCDVDATQPEPAPTIFFTAGNDPLTFRSPFNLEHTATTAKVYTHLGASITDTRASGLDGTSDPHWVMAVASNSADKPEAWVNGERVGVAASGVADGIFQTVLEATIGGGTVGSDPLNRWFKGPIGEIVMFDGLPTGDEFTALFADELEPRWPTLSWSFV